MNQRLTAITYAKDGDFPYRLHFQATTTEDGSTRDCGGQSVVKAKKIILAMPRRSLELIDSPFFSDPGSRTISARCWCNRRSSSSSPMNSPGGAPSGWWPGAR
ncbi:hypothetical protein QNM99_11690 [Pseudomonas sp. PCH446]